MIYVTGDIHMPIDIEKLSMSYFPEQRKMTKNDYVIICGDFGGVWRGGKEEKQRLVQLDKKNFTTLFVDGNHENFNLLNNFDVIDYCGGKAHKIADGVYHLMRGQVFTIDGIRFFTMGGASSHDMEYRTEGKSWWPEELPSNEEYDEARNNLDKYNWEVDYVVSHCAADSIQSEISDYYGHDKLTNFFEAVIKKELKYKHWYFGHYHYDCDVDDKHTCLYYRIIEIPPIRL